MDLTNTINKFMNRKQFEAVKDVPCDVLKQEIKRHKELAYKKRLEEANAKADRIDNLINEILKEYEGTEAGQTRVEYAIAKQLYNNCSVSRGYYRSKYDEGHDDYLINDIQRSISNILSSPASMRQLLMIYRENYRKHLISNIKEECDVGNRTGRKDFHI